MADIRFVKTDKLKEKPDVSKIGFGTHFTDYMFMMDFDRENGWHDARIVPYEDIKISPANTTLHYGQAIFEGCKAYRYEGGKAVVFRAKDHIARLNRSAKILDIPEVDEKLESYYTKPQTDSLIANKVNHVFVNDATEENCDRFTDWNTMYHLYING